MANPGAGSKFVSVNLNKSYGQRTNNYSGGASRVRSTTVAANHGVVGGGGASGGGMVVLSRSRSTIVGVQKGGPKLSVPPPLNLPSLRKEHEKFDSSSSGGGVAGSGSSGPGARPSSAGIGWTKPAAVVVQEKDGGGGGGGGGDDHSLFERSGVGSPRINSTGISDQMSRGSSVYMPPSARSGTSVATPSHEFPSVQRAVLLRGEDFPSLQASLPVVSGASQKQKDGLNQKQNQNQKVSSDTDEHLGNSHLRPPSAMQTQNNQSSRLNDKVSDDKEGMSYRNGGSRNNEPLRKQDDIFPSPLPLVRLHHTSDWADDERDTGHGIPDRDRDQGYSKSEFLWDRDFDFPRASVPPRTSVQNRAENRGLHNDETGRPPSGGYLRGNTYNRDMGNPSREGREGSSWRASSLVKDGSSSDRNSIGARALGGNRENVKEMKHGQPHYWDGARDGVSNGFSGSQDSRYGRRDIGYGQGTRQSGNHFAESYNSRGVEQTKMDSYGGDFSNRYRGDSFQNGSLTKTSNKGYFVNDPVISVSREKRSTSGKQYMEEPFLKDFGSNSDYDGRDPLTGNLVGVLKRKKDVLKETEFHDPVRESFEAELERVQKLQEQERQRVIEEQARALELARREEEERERVAREEEERQRRHEEEVREAAWRAEQERLEALRRAEEQRVAREEEKRRMLLEEERRKEAARKKLLELEARIAKRQAEITKENELSSGVRDQKISGVFQEKDATRIADVVDWEDGERMVERITSSASSDSSSLTRPFDTSSRPHFQKDGDSTFHDRGKLSNSWRRDVFDNGSNSAFIWQDQESGYRSPKRDPYGAGRQFVRKEFSGGSGTMPAKASFRGFPENPMVDHYPPARGNRWNLSGEDDYSRNSDYDPEFHENFADRFSDMGWGLGPSRPSHHASYPERSYQNFDADGFSPFGGKSRHIMRQPRVLPPPSVASISRSTFRSEIEPPSSSAFRDRELSYHHSPGKNEPILQKRYDIGFEEEPDQPRNVDSLEEKPRSHELKNDTPRCDSQSSLSVSSPPSSPTHLSHDDMEDSEEPPSKPTAVEGDEILFSDNEHDVSVAEVSAAIKLGVSTSIPPLEDDEWDIDNHQDSPEQEEYDEEEDGYREDDEVHDMDDGDRDLQQEFADLQLEEDSPSKKDRPVMSFDESLDVVMPTDENVEVASTNGEKTAGLQQVSSNISEVGSHDRLEQSAQSGSDSSKGKEESSEVIPEYDKPRVDLDIQPVSAVQGSDASAGSHFDSVDASTLPLDQPLAFSGDMTFATSTTEATTSTVTTNPSQTDGPVKLQFGLFSGPSLIPSPVPAIQIGSIQMPLHLHPQVGHSLAQLHPTPPPYFQFGQLRYTAPGILPLGPQSMSFVQPPVSSQGAFNHNQNGSSNNQVVQDNSILTNSGRDKMTAVSVDNQISVQNSQEDSSKDLNVLSARQDAESGVTQSHSRGDSSILGDGNLRSQSISQENSRYQYFGGKKIYRPNVSNRVSHSQLHAESTISQFISKAPGPSYGSKGKRYVVKNSGPRQPIPVSEPVQTELRGFQQRARPKFSRTEFRVRENVDRRQTDALDLLSHLDPERPNFSGKVSGVVRRTSKQMPEAEGFSSESLSACDVGSESKKATYIYSSHSREETSKRYGNFDEDIDAPLRSGVVRVFEQPGIEAPSDEDDFIEVRSKRQMLNDRREQREKEIKAKARIVKAPKKRRSAPQNNIASTFSARTSSSFGGPSNSTYSKSVISSDQSLERQTRYSKNLVTPPLAPIGTPVNSDAQADKRTYTTKSPHTGSTPVLSTNGTSLVSNRSFENTNNLLDTVPTSLSPWGNARMNQQVMALTQTQLDEAMKPARFESHVPSIGDRTSAVIEPSKLSSSVVTQEKSFSSTASPLNSLLAGEKIQFGAVTSPTILPPSSHITSSVMEPPGSCMSAVPVEHNLSVLENCSLFFEKEKHLNESSVDLGDSEAEAEAAAAASAVAVAAISSDETVGNGCSVSASETKTFGGAENEGLASEGGISNQQSGSRSRAEESLSVALPADLSVETPSLSLWPSLPSPHHSSSQIMSHFPGGPPSHFPCYEMNPMLGGPIFAFGPHDEAAATQMQTQKSSVSASGPMGAWQQCHSGVDSFYGPPAGFTGPYISSSGGIPGVQGPPHMVVYNHFTPVGQFGQVGLSFMGATYIPSGKQPDWKHTPASSTMGMGEGDINNMSIPSVQHSAPNMPPPIQHLAPGSPLLPLGSPLAMFDMSPFQPSADVPVQARWSHFSAPPLHSAPLPMPLPQHVEGVLSSQFSQGSSVDQSVGNRFHESSSSAASDSGRNFSVESVSSVSQFPDELGLVETSSTTTSQVPTSRPASYSSTITNGNAQSEATQNLTGNIASNAGDSSSSNNSNNSSNQSMNASVNTSSAQQQAPSTQQYLHSTGYNDQRGVGVSQKVASGGEWSHRRMGFPGRTQSSGTDKKVPHSRVKQIYVAKPATNQTST